MTTAVLLICAGATRSSRIGGFPALDEPLDEPGRRAAAAAAPDPRFRANVVLSPMLSAVETVAAMGLAAREEPALADIDHGSWAGHTFEDIHAREPDALARWLIDPTLGVAGGEPMQGVETRIGRWLDDMAQAASPVCAVTHATVIRAALAHALHLPLRSTLAIDVAPLSRTLLSFNRSWRLQAIGPAD